MADYKRMVSYMYQYEHGIKKKNVGYVKIEARNGLCKITVHMQLLGHLDSIFPTYLIQRKKGDLELIYLGDTVLKNQVMDSKLSAEEANIMGSGYNLSDMGGLLIFLNNNIFFATEWDDKPVLEREVLEALKPKNKKKYGPEAKDKKNPIETNTKTTINISDTIKDKAADEDKDRNGAADYTGINPMEGYTLEEELKLPTYKLPRGWKTIERNPKQMQGNKEAVEAAYIAYVADKVHEVEEVSENDEINTSDEGNLLNEANVTEEVKAVDKVNTANEVNTANGVNVADEANVEDKVSTADEINIADEVNIFDEVNRIDEVNIADEISRAEKRNRVDYVDGANEVEGVERVDIKDDSMEAKYSDHYGMENAEKSDNNQPAATSDNYEEAPENKTARHFFTHYTRIYPFEDNEIERCVKIEPKDIGLLPKELWAFSNNSFLMHGYYCYHHLIFAKMKNGSSYRYILGVPGIYHNREQFMARMFGFEKFKSIRKRELRQGDFGYWLLQVNF